MNNKTEQKYRETLQKASARIKDLHREVEALKKREPIVIVGMACRFPGGGTTPEKFWKVLEKGIDAVIEVPEDRWDAKKYFDPDPAAPGKVYTVMGGYLDIPIDRFDASFFTISPKEAAKLDPQQRLLLEITWEAFENSGINPASLKGSQTGVFIGISGDDYTESFRLPGLYNDINAYSITGTTSSTAAGRISYVFGLEGPCIALDTACSSSLVSLHLACQSLQSKECDAAVVGGVMLGISPATNICFARLRVVSQDGRCKTFDASADGYSRGEGCGVVVVKRLSDAVRDNNRILAVIKGSAINQDGASSGLTAPSGAAQQKVIRKALEKANVSPGDVSYVETHGTGTALGDPIEVEAICNILKDGHSKENPLIIGSVKTNIGHLESASGVAALMKVILAFQHDAIPPNLHFKRPSPYIPWNDLPVKVPTELMPWPKSQKSCVAGINSFGFSGTNAHVVLEKWDSGPKGEAEGKTGGETAEETGREIAANGEGTTGGKRAIEVDTEKGGEKQPGKYLILPLAAKNENALAELGAEYIKYLSETSDDIGDICHTAGVGRSHFEYRLAFTGRSREDLKDDLKEELLKYKSDNSLQRIPDNTDHLDHLDHIDSRVAFFFTGQGAQYIGMGRSLFDREPVFNQTLKQCDVILQRHMNRSLIEILYSENAEESLLNQTRYTQPALFSLEYALYSLWKSWGIIPSVMMGHSVGEYVAACAAGVFSLKDGLKLISKRAQLMHALSEGGEMAAVMADETKVADAILSYRDTLSIAAVNGPKNIVISGKRESLKAVCTRFQAQGIKTTALKVSHGFHSGLMEPMMADFQRICREVDFSSPQTDIVSNVTGKIVSDEITSPDYWVKHVRKTVRFADSMNTLEEHGYEIFLEAGPKPVLLGMGRNCLPNHTGLWLPSLHLNRPDGQQMLQSLKELYINGVDVDWSGFYRDYSGKRVVLPNYPFQRQRHWTALKEVRDVSHEKMQKVSWIHPLIEKQISSPLLKETLFESCFNTDTLPFLNDHRIFNEVVVSAASHISLLLGAVTLKLQSSSFILEELFFLQVLVIPENDSRIVQLLMTPDTDQTIAFKLISFNLESLRQNDDYTVHVTGRVKEVKDAGLSDHPLFNIEDIWKQCPDEITASDIYDMQKQRGILLGPGYHWIQTVHTGKNQAVCKMKSPEILKRTEEYQLHPGLIDSCFGLLVTAADVDEDETYIPFRIKAFKYYQTSGNSQLYAWAVLGEKSEDGHLTGDIQLFDQSGQMCAEIIGLEGRKAGMETILRGVQKNFNNLLYEVKWIEALPYPEVQEKKIFTHSDKWLIISDRCGIGEKLAELLEKNRQQCRLVFSDMINPEDSRAFNQIFKENPGNFKGIIHLGVIENVYKENEKGLPQQPPVVNLQSTLNLLQSMINEKFTEPPVLYFVTQGAMQLGSETVQGETVQGKISQTSLLQTPLWGMARVVFLEHPEFCSLCIDLDPSALPVQNAAALYEELQISGRENQIVIRENHKGLPLRFVQRLAKTTLHTTDYSVSFDEKAGYLITGGLGGLGLEIAAWMIENGARYIVLSGRSGGSKFGAQEAVHLLEASGAKVMVVKADISIEDDAVRMFHEIKAEMPQLKGVIHAAGVLADGLLRQQTWERFHQVISPKAHGAWHLHTFTLNMPLDFFVCFSSISSLFGTAAQGNYAAGNAFMDGLAHYRRAMGLPGLSINWGPFAKAGMAADLRKQAQKRITKQGLTGLLPKDGLAVLGTLLKVKQETAQVGVFQVSWQKFMHHFYKVAEQPFFEAFVEPATQKMIDREPQLLMLLKAAKLNERHDLLINHIRSLAAKVLDFNEPEQIGLRQRLFDLGIDSLMAVDLKNYLEADLGHDLDSTLVFDYPMVEAIADHLIEGKLSALFIDSSITEEDKEQEQDQDTFQSELENISDAEAEAMLLSEIEKMGLD